MGKAYVKPEVVDNLRGNTLATALNGYLRWLRKQPGSPRALSIATCYFNPQGFSLVSKELGRLPGVRLLLGVEPEAIPSQRPRQLGEPRGERYDAARIEKALKAYERGLETDRDLLGFSPEVDQELQELIALLDSGRVEVRRYEQAFLHGKAFVIGDDKAVISGSSNLTAAGLTTNLELNLGQYRRPLVSRVRNWFDELWGQAAPFDLAAIYKARYVEYDPYLIYLRALWERYQHELEEEQIGVDGRIRLTTFQNDGIFRAKKILERYHGVLIADGVGLGKTYIGGELIRQATEGMRQRVLLISPAALRDGTWRTFSDRHQLYLENVSFEGLLQDEQFGGVTKTIRDMNEYAMVVIDEAHAFRNPDTERARALRLLLRGAPPKKLVLMTATPVNNALWDLYYLLNYFLGHDAVFADVGIRSVKDRFQVASKEDPFSLKPDMLFDILDAVAVRRTRHFVRKYYPMDTVIGPGGKEILVRFPDPKVRSVVYRFEGVLPGFFEDFREALAPESGEPALSLARYSPSKYRKISPKEDKREAALLGLLRSGLLKRFESSAHAFGRTAERMAKDHDTFLRALEQGMIPTQEFIEEWREAEVEEWRETDSDEAFNELLATRGHEPVANYDVEALKEAVQRDRDLLRRFAQRASGVSQDSDPKLGELRRIVTDIVRNAERDATDEQDARNKRKILIFSFFEDTVDWIEEYLRRICEADDKLACYRGRIASVSGEESRGGISREHAILGFAPVSMEAPSSQEDLYDILVTTDVLSEGVNLQQCRNIVNFDLPWNPMRLVQRHGRIDRIGSAYPEVFVWCTFPDRKLDELLNLEERIRRKLAQAAASIGVESEVLPGSETSEIVFAETREQIEALRREEVEIFVNAGEDPKAHSGEEYRQELRKGLEERGAAIKGLPWAAGSGFRGGSARGHFFCARVGDRVFFRFIGADGTVVKDTYKCLRMITCDKETPRYLAPDLKQMVYDAWKVARKGIFDEWTFATDPANLQPRVPPVLQAAARHLRKYPPKVTQHELDRVLDCLEAPRSIRIQREVRELLEASSGDPYILSQALVDKVNELGLQPFVPPEPLPVIDEDEVALVCWLAVDT